MLAVTAGAAVRQQRPQHRHGTTKRARHCCAAVVMLVLLWLGLLLLMVMLPALLGWTLLGPPCEWMQTDAAGWMLRFAELSSQAFPSLLGSLRNRRA